ncbi:MAG: hypothetical protein A4E58_00985 [Syntrophorhabdus sp. PtaB.Bin006]|nr:MAG: hypothetical protein A4E58_00985 [Syntrophorhabdus sp. PtaB.Bin006]
MIGRVVLAGNYTVCMLEGARHGRARTYAFPNKTLAVRKKITIKPQYSNTISLTSACFSCASPAHRMFRSAGQARPNNS